MCVSYRSDIADTRYSPVENFYKYCKNEGLNILLHDPYVKYWDELSLEVNNDLDKILENNLDIIVISTNHSEYVNNEKFINKLLAKRLHLYDTVGVFSELEIKKVSKNTIYLFWERRFKTKYEKRKVFILGGGGFIGSAIARNIGEKKVYDITIGDNFYYNQNDMDFMTLLIQIK